MTCLFIFKYFLLISLFLFIYFNYVFFTSASEMLLQLLFCLLFLVKDAMSGCNVLYGPARTTECVAFSVYYNQYQWATCLSNTYIQQKRNHKHICTYRSANYCYYQCMIEVHGKASGLVSKDCSCTPSSSKSTPYPNVSPTSALPPECYSPSGKSCQWYRGCLEKKYPCEATSNAYAITFAEKFCSLYEQKRLCGSRSRASSGLMACASACKFLSCLSFVHGETLLVKRYVKQRLILTCPATSTQIKVLHQFVIWNVWNTSRSSLSSKNRS